MNTNEMLLPGEVPVLRTCRAGGLAHADFRWPLEVGAVVEAPDWSPEAECGHGLHGLLRGEGDGSLLYWEKGAVWMVVATQQVVEIGRKVKFPRCRILHVGDQKSSADLMQRLAPGGAIVGATVTAGDSGTATAGYRGTATAGYRGTATAGDSGTATAGDSGTATAGDSGTATAGYRGTATAGDSGTATAGYRGTATAGDSGTATAGYGGTATAGYSGTIVIKHWDGNRYRLIVGYVGEDGIEAKVKYKVDAGKLVRA